MNGTYESAPLPDEPDGLTVSGSNIGKQARTRKETSSACPVRRVAVVLASSSSTAEKRAATEKTVSSASEKATAGAAE